MPTILPAPSTPPNASPPGSCRTPYDANQVMSEHQCRNPADAKRHHDDGLGVLARLAGRHDDHSQHECPDQEYVGEERAEDRGLAEKSEPDVVLALEEQGQPADDDQRTRRRAGRYAKVSRYFLVASVSTGSTPWMRCQIGLSLPHPGPPPVRPLATLRPCGSRFCRAASVAPASCPASRGRRHQRATASPSSATPPTTSGCSGCGSAPTSTR